MIRDTMAENNIIKVPGKSWMYDPAGVCHVFYANDVKHPKAKV